MQIFLFGPISMLLLFSRSIQCTSESSVSFPKAGPLGEADPNSYANIEEAKVVDIHLNLEVNFDRKILNGSVTLTVEKVKDDSPFVLLDSRDLTIHDVVDNETGEKLDFQLDDPGFLGSRLQVQLPEKQERSQIRISYETAPSSSALEWLTPAQTEGKTHPYLFSQCEPINCRTMIPLQDTPSVKSPYSAEIVAPGDFVVLMSAIRQGEPEEVDGGKKKVHKFLQKVPIPSYLIAIAVGNLESRQIGPRSHVWSEKELVDQAAEEFGDVENMLQKAEEICGPYVWGIYDILLLPNSFAHGGMENPCLTFTSPTLLAGDKSLVYILVHEIVHSWAGNLVTNKNFDHFWLNEGFTMFTERIISGHLSPSGRAQRDFQGIGGWKDLTYEISVLGETNPLTALVVNLTDVDPIDAFSIVPYEKGSVFLWYLEDIIGGQDKMEPFLKSYYEEFKFQSIDSFQFRDHFLNFFKNESKISKIDWDEWLFNPGMPSYKPAYDDTLAKACIALKDKWVKWKVGEEPSTFQNKEFSELSTHQQIEFLSLLLEEKDIGIPKLEQMEKVYGLSDMKNSEIRYRWIRLGLINRWEDAVPRAIQMLSETGRQKFVRPIYRDLYNWEEKRHLAVETFEKNRDSLTSLVIDLVEKTFNAAS